MKYPTYCALIVCLLFSTISFSQTYTVSAPEMFSNENNAPNDLTFTFTGIQECITSDITLEVCIRGDLDGDCSAGGCTVGLPCPGCSSQDETAEIFLNGVSTGVVMGNTDEDNFQTGGGGFCEPICQTITIPCDAAAIAVATGTLTVLFSTGSDVNSAVPGCAGAPGTIRFGASIESLTYNGDPNISFSGQTNFCVGDNVNELITVEGTCDVIGGFAPIPLGFTDNGDNTANFNPFGLAAGSYRTTYSYTCGSSLYSEELVFNILTQPTNLSIDPSTICNTGDSDLTLLGNDVPEDGTLLVWAGMGAAAPFVTDSGTSDDVTGTFLAGAPPGVYTVCVAVSDGLGGTCFVIPPYCEDITVTSGPVIPTSVEIDLICQTDGNGDVALTELFFGLSNPILANATYTVSGGSIVGGAFI